MKTTQAPTSSGESVSLPAPTRAGRVSLEDALSRRRSVREFAAKPFPEAVLGQLLWAAQGVTHPDGLRTAPSAGALYPLEVYVATATGFYHYNPRRHALERRSSSDLRPALARAALEQESVRQAGAVIVFAATIGFSHISEMRTDAAADGTSPFMADRIQKSASEGQWQITLRRGDQ